MSSERNRTSCERKERVNVSDKQGGCERAELNSGVFMVVIGDIRVYLALVPHREYSHVMQPSVCFI